jgi:hypothetical protein
MTLVGSAEALVKVGKNGKASGVAIFKYVHDHFDMPANDRLVRNHLHQVRARLPLPAPAQVRVD